MSVMRRLGPCLAALLGLAGCTASELSFREADSLGARRSLAAGEGTGIDGIPQFDPQTGEPIQPRLGLDEAKTLTSFEAPTEAGQGPAPAQAPEAAKRLMIYRSRFQLLVANVQDSIARFLKRVEDLRGYLETRENDRVVIRVPAEYFQKLSEEIRGYGLVVNESTQAVDVTKQFFDLKIRIENAEKSRLRLLALLDRAEAVDATLKIEAELRRLTEEIDRLKGELQRLSEQIAFSTIEVLFRSNAPPPRSVPQRKRSRFDWVNEIGVEHVLERF